MQLRLSEELLLLALNEKKGTFVPFKTMIFKYGAAGAILHELMNREKLKLDENAEYVVFLNLDPTGDAILDKALETLAKTEKQKKLQHWIAKLGGRFKEFKQILLGDLINRSILRKVETEDRNPWSFSGGRFQIWFDRPVISLRKRLHDTLVYGKNPDPETLKLIGLVRACKLHKNIFKEKTERETAWQRLEELSENDAFRKAIKKIINSQRVSAASSIFSAAIMLLKEAC
jgi:hypothetical protein